MTNEAKLADHLLTIEDPRAGCAFCDRALIASEVTDFGDVMVFEPLNPVASGHRLIVPKQHVPDFSSDPRVSADLMAVASDLAAREGGSFNLITSKGVPATQSVMHLHLHLIPRTEGDGLRLPWTRDSGRHPEGGNSRSEVEGEACQSGVRRDASPTSISETPHEA